MSCAAFTIVSLLAALAHHGDSWMVKVTISLAGLFLLSATFAVWRDERRCLISALEKEQKPKLTLDVSKIIRSIALPSNSSLDSGRTFIARVTIVNLTAIPTTVRSVRIRTLSADRQASPLIPGVALTWHETQKVLNTLDGKEYSQNIPCHEFVKDDLLTSLRDSPLVKGSHREGWVLFDDVPFEWQDQSVELFLCDGFG